MGLVAVALFAVAGWSTAWLTLPAAALWDLATRRQRWPTLRFLVLALGYPLMQLTGVLFLAPTALLRWHPRWQAWNDRFQSHWGSWTHRYLHRVYDLTLQVEGAEALSPGPVLMLMRHTSQADTVLVPHLVGIGLGRTLRYVLKRDLRNDPCFDMLGARGHHAFVSRGQDPIGDRAQLAWLMTDLRPEDVVVIYPEGTRTSPQKKRQLAERLAEKGETALLAYASTLKHLLPPRLGGTLAMLEDSPGCDLIVCGHVGLEGASRFELFREGALIGKTVRVRFWRVPWADVPAEPAAREAWLLDRWKALDDWVEAVTHPPSR